MEEVQTGGEPKVVVPNEAPAEAVIVDDKPATPPATEAPVVVEEPVIETEVVLPTDADVLDTLEKTVQPVKTPSRKEISKEKWQKRYDETIAEDGTIDVVALKALYSKNPKGLEDFVASNQLDMDDVMIDLSEPANDTKVNERLAQIESHIQTENDKKQASAFRSRLVELTAEAGLSVQDFNTKYGEPFSAEVKKFTDQGVNLIDATEAAFALTAGQSVVRHKEEVAEKANVLESAVDMPDGMLIADKQFTKLLPAAEVNAMDTADRLAYKAQYKDENGYPVYSD